jgi:cobalt-zinc-cadmium resistance protein CzcA
MIRRIVLFSLRNPAFVLIAGLAMLVWGAMSFFQLPIEAYPDVMNTQVQVITQWPGHAAEEVEQLITVPMETSLNSVAHVSSLRSRSMFGLSVVYLTFEDGVDDYFAHQQVLEQVGQADIPTGLQPNLSPMASATGEIFRYRLTGASVMDLKTIEDWTLEREFKSIPGVADVNSFGGTTKQYQVLIDPQKLKAYEVTLKNVTDALSAANANAGGSVVELGSEEYVVRGMGLFHSLDDIRNVVIASHAGTPLRVSDVAKVQIGHVARLGKVGWREGGSPDDHDDAVQGIVLLRRDATPGPVLEAIHKKIAALNNGILPAGVKIVPTVDRTDLVNTTSHTVEHNLLEGIILVVFVLFLFLGNVRAATIVAITIPFGLFFAFSCMNLIHVPANLLSLGAIDFGVIVNGAVILVENVYRNLARRNAAQSVFDCILSAISEVQSEIFFTTLIIILGYLPLITMQSVEKKMFSPMAYTIGLALIGSLIMALAIAPALCFLALKGKLRDKEPKWELWMKHVYGKSLAWTLRNPLPTLAAGIGMVLMGFTVFPRLGMEFLPHLDEGNLWIRATMPTTISYSEASKLMPKIRGIMAHYQPARIVVSQLGRPDDGTDATGFYNAEFLVDLKPHEQWIGYPTKDDLIKKMNTELGEIPGVNFNFSQNIEDNVEEAVTGVKGELAVKMFGDDLDVLEKKAAEIQTTLAKVPGVVDLSTFTETGEPQVTIRPDRAKIARYGINIQDVEDVVATAIGGSTVTQFLDGERKFDVQARLTADNRKNLDEIRNISVSTPDGQRIPLGQLADIKTERGASFVYREANHRFIAIKFGVRGRDLGGVVKDCQTIVGKQVAIPNGYHLEWGGEFESMQRATARLMIVTPITLVLIFLVLYALFKSVNRAFIVIATVPLSMIGGILALYFTHFHFSVSAAVGFIALFGVAVQNRVMMVSYFDYLQELGVHFMEAISFGALTRLRPVLMTATLATIGLIPAAISTGIGSDTQKPLAIAIIGGLVVDVFTGTLFVLPVLYSVMAKPAKQVAPAGGAINLA